MRSQKVHQRRACGASCGNGFPNSVVRWIKSPLRAGCQRAGKTGHLRAGENRPLLERCKEFVGFTLFVLESEEVTNVQSSGSGHDISSYNTLCARLVASADRPGTGHSPGDGETASGVGGKTGQEPARRVGGALRMAATAVEPAPHGPGGYGFKTGHEGPARRVRGVGPRRRSLRRPGQLHSRPGKEKKRTGSIANRLAGRQPQPLPVRIDHQPQPHIGKPVAIHRPRHGKLHLVDVPWLRRREAAWISGESGIRTHEALAHLPVFETGAFSRSAISPASRRPGSDTAIMVSARRRVKAKTTQLLETSVAAEHGAFVAVGENQNSPNTQAWEIQHSAWGFFLVRAGNPRGRLFFRLQHGRSAQTRLSAGRNSSYDAMEAEIS